MPWSKGEESSVPVELVTADTGDWIDMHRSGGTGAVWRGMS